MENQKQIKCAQIAGAFAAKKTAWLLRAVWKESFIVGAVLRIMKKEQCSKFETN